MTTNAITHGDDLVAPKQSKWFRVLSFIVFAVVLIALFGISRPRKEGEYGWSFYGRPL